MRCRQAKVSSQFGDIKETKRKVCRTLSDALMYSSMLAWQNDERFGIYYLPQLEGMGYATYVVCNHELSFGHLIFIDLPELENSISSGPILGT